MMSQKKLTEEDLMVVNQDVQEVNKVLEKSHLLSLKVKINDNNYGYVFTMEDKSETWKCHICDETIQKQEEMPAHIQGKKHKSRLALPSYPSCFFSKIENKASEMLSSLGFLQPFPPGCEEEEKEKELAEKALLIQPLLDSHTRTPLLGLEYVVEVTAQGNEPRYFCTLCDKFGDPRVILSHISSYMHQLQYLGAHFPTVHSTLTSKYPNAKLARKALTEIVFQICEVIEKKNGRLRPIAVEKRFFDLKKEEIKTRIRNSHHFRETPGELFKNIISPETNLDSIILPSGMSLFETEEKSSGERTESSVPAKTIDVCIKEKVIEEASLKNEADAVKTSDSTEVKDEDPFDIKKKTKEPVNLSISEKQSMLSTKVKLDNGGYGFVFSIKYDIKEYTWTCHLCCQSFKNQKTMLTTHVGTDEHKTKMSLKSHPAKLFARIEEEIEVSPETDILVEPEENVSSLVMNDTTFEFYRSLPLIGMEFIVKLFDKNLKNTHYMCMLCDKKGDPRITLTHLTSYAHQSKYIGIYFPVAKRTMDLILPKTKAAKKGKTEIVYRLCLKLDEKFGFLQNLVVDKNKFSALKDYIWLKIEDGPHFSESKETVDDWLLSVIDPDVMDDISDDVLQPIVQGVPLEDVLRAKIVYKKREELKKMSVCQITADELKKELEEKKHLLSFKVLLDNGNHGFVFSVKQGDKKNIWTCHVCQETIPGKEFVVPHIESKKHQTKLLIPTHPASVFSRVEEDCSNAVKPDMIVHIQGVLDSHQSSILVGLEYLIEIFEDGIEPFYKCLLCDKRSDPRIVLSHLSSFQHYSKFLTKHFPLASERICIQLPNNKAGKRAIMEAERKVCKKVEEKYGRLTPTAVENKLFEEYFDVINKYIEDGPHFKDSDGEILKFAETLVLGETISPEKSTPELEIQSPPEGAFKFFNSFVIPSKRNKMEGYTNISGNHEDFNELDIEEKSISDDWNNEEDDIKKESALAEEKRFLSLKVKLDNGEYCPVFSLKQNDKSVRWKCNVCDVIIISQKHVGTHLQTQKHVLKMALPAFPALLYPRIESNLKVAAPESEIQVLTFMSNVTEIQNVLDNKKNTAFLGLEYVIELTPDESDKEPSYICMLCDKKGDPRVIINHIISFNHRTKYIGIHFPTANKKLFNEFPNTKLGKKEISSIINRLSSKIEEKFGRLQPLSVEREMFDFKKDYIIKTIRDGQHLRETQDETFEKFVEVCIMEEEMKPKDTPSTTIEAATTCKDDDAKSSFIKGKISCDRTKLRSREVEEGDDDVQIISDEKNSAPNNSAISNLRRSLSLSSLSSSSHSRSPSLSRSRSRSRSRYDQYGSKSSAYRKERWSRHRRSRSRSGSRKYRSRSRSRRSHSHSPGPRYGRRISPGGTSGKGHYYNRRSRSPKYNRYRDRSGDGFRFRENSNRGDNMLSEKAKWEKFRQEVNKIECDLAKNLIFHEKNPEKHPMYPEEWKKFWNRRYKELQAEGKDPATYDFKPEWIEFWNKRLKEMHEEELKNKKEDLKLKIGLPKESDLQPIRPMFRKQDGGSLSPAHERDYSNDKKLFKRIEGKEKRRSPCPLGDTENHSKYQKISPSRKFSRDNNNSMRERDEGVKMLKPDCSIVVNVLRLLTALENQLGSLGPRINSLLSTALSEDKKEHNCSDRLLLDIENVILLETVKEKLVGQLLAGIVEGNMVQATKSCIQHLNDTLSKAEDMKRSEPVPEVSKMPIVSELPTVSKTPAVSQVPISTVTSATPVTVPGVGTMDKIAIAKQIAGALVAQGKTDVTQEELEQLINAIVGMAQASVGAEKPITTASYVDQLQDQVLGRKSAHVMSETTAMDSPLQKLLSVVKNSSVLKQFPDRNALQLLQSAYDEPVQSPETSLVQKSDKAVSITYCKTKFPPTKSSGFSMQKKSVSLEESMEDLTEEDLQNLFHNFSDLSSEEQHGLVTYLKKLEVKDPERVERLRCSVDFNIPGFQKSIQFNVNSLMSTKDKPEDSMDGRLSPFSLRQQGGINPSKDSEYERDNANSNRKLDDSDDDDYTFEDIYAAASKTVKEREKKMEEENKMMENKNNDASKILRETKEMIVNLMGKLPSKQVTPPNVNKVELPSIPKDVPNCFNETPRAEAKAEEVVNKNVQVVPTLQDTRRSYQNYHTIEPSYNHYNSQPSFSTNMQNYQQGFSDPQAQQFGNYYEKPQQQYGGENYSNVYTSQGTSTAGTWVQYPKEVVQRSFQKVPDPTPYKQYPYQPTYY